MMRYLPHTDADIAAMLETVGVDSLDALFSSVPEDCRMTSGMDLPPPLTEWELENRLRGLAGTVADGRDYHVYLGAGSYQHYVPAIVPYLLGRGEFATAYTPYQPEVSQGTLQAVFEYQTLVARLLGLEAANASMYDGASGLAEGLLMAGRVTKRRRLAISSLVHPLYRRVIQTYLGPSGYDLIELPFLKDGRTDLSPVDGLEDLAAVVIQSPNFFGTIEDLATASQKAQAQKALLVAAFTEPLAFGLFKNPGRQGADIACGEGQSLGIPQSYGGPGVGMFAAKMDYIRNMPGRLVGQTVDKEGRRGFVLTLATREQHIRRAKATSNICTNGSLCALTTAAFMAALGGTGLRKLARLNYDKTEYLKAEFKKAGIDIAFSAPTFNEFVARFPSDFSAARRRLLDKNIVAGLPLAEYYPELDNHYLFCVTEVHSKADLDLLVKEVTS